MQSSSVGKLSFLRRGFRTYFLIPKRRREGIIAKKAVSPGVHKAQASLLWSTGSQNFSSNLLPRERSKSKFVARAEHRRPHQALKEACSMASTANQYGSLIFCSRCGTLLDLPGDEDQLVCDGCGQVEDATGT